MKPRWTALGFLICVVTTSHLPAAEPPHSSVSHRVLKYCDPVCELQAQDSAFSLLLEVYREHTAHRIQAQYESRINAAAAMSEEHGSLLIQADSEGMRTLRAWVLELAEQERDLSLQQLQQDVENYKVAYGCARRVEEQELGHRVPSKVNTETAAAQLRQYNIVAVADTTGSGLRLVRPLSAQSVLLDAEPAEPTGPKIEPCE